MAYISEIKSKDDPSSASDYIEVTLAPGEVASDFDIVIYQRNGNLIETLDLETGTVVTLPNGTQIYSLSVSLWEGGNPNGPAAVALVSSPSTVEQFLAVGTVDVTANGGPADGLVATAAGNSSPGDSHYWEADGTYAGTAPSSPGAICFAKGTLIETKQGARRVEDLVAGDLVQTRDNGYQALRWIGSAHRTARDTAKHENLRPVIVRKDAFGLGCPEQDLVLSRQHRILSSRPANCLLFGEAESLVAAKHMVNNTSIVFGGVCDISYYHLMFDAHEVVRSNSMWTESFLPNQYALSTLSDAGKTEFNALFPDLGDPTSDEGYFPARYIVNRVEAAALLA